MVKKLQKKFDWRGWWDSPTTQRIVPMLAIPVGYLTLVPLAYKLEENLKDENGAAQIRGFGGNFAALYAAIMVTPVIVEAAKGIAPLIPSIMTAIK